METLARVGRSGPGPRPYHVGVEELSELPVAIWWVAGAVTVVSLVILVVALVDLARREVRHLPKPIWALIMVAVSFPLGVIAYFVFGRVSPRSAPVDAPATPAPATATTSRLAEDLAGGDAPPSSTVSTDDLVVSTRGLVKTYRDATALRGVALAVPRGAVYGLIGPNGAGKTTLLSILAGLRRPTSGEVDWRVPRPRIGVLVDTPQFEPWLTAYEVVDLARRLTAPQAPAERVRAALDQAGLADAADRWVGGFSRGMLQRLGLAGCLVSDPEVLLLDEPVSALDPAGRREVLDLLARLAHSKTVLLSTHILADVQQLCDTVGVIHQGELRYQGPLATLLSHTTTAYSLHVRSPADGLVEVLRREPWLTDVVEQAPGRLRLVVSDAAHAERAVPALLASGDHALVSFQPATDLETAFLELTS